MAHKQEVIDLNERECSEYIIKCKRHDVNINYVKIGYHIYNHYEFIYEPYDPLVVYDLHLMKIIINGCKFDLLYDSDKLRTHKAQLHNEGLLYVDTIIEKCHIDRCFLSLAGLNHFHSHVCIVDDREDYLTFKSSTIFVEYDRRNNIFDNYTQIFDNVGYQNPNFEWKYHAYGHYQGTLNIPDEW